MTMLLSCEKLRVGYGGTAILPPIDLAIEPGEFWAVLGRNGSGKTTLFRTLLGLIPPIAGSITKRGPDQRSVYVPQLGSFDDLFPMLAREVVGQGCERGWSFLVPRVREPAAVRSALEEVDALALADRLFRALSEGQKRRVLLARIIASGASLALLDEPTATMDGVAEQEAFEHLDRIRRTRGIAVVVVSHHLGAARRTADHAVFLDREAGVVVVGTPADVVAHPAFVRRYGSTATSGDRSCDE
jgi:zinc transport system ATP-binding protein